jgi:RNA polymerase sigma-70 factor, ECF subfamily
MSERSMPIDQTQKTEKTRVREQDQIWVERAQAGDQEAFRHLVERYQRRVYAVAYGIVRNRDDAWDVAQEAFVKAYRNLTRFQGKSGFYTWLYRITYNLCIDSMRARSRRSFVEMDSNRMLQAAVAKEAPLETHPAKNADRRELARVIETALDELSDKHRAIIVLREIEGLSYEEMAEVLKVSKGTVMSRLFHARRKLQDLLKPYVNDGQSVLSTFKLSPQRS